MDKRILIVDDEKSILDMLSTYLKSQTDFEVTTATSGIEAMDILNKKRYPIIISDLKMPGINGLDFCRWIRETNPLSHVIAITGYQDFFELKECRSIGFDDYFKKPFDLEDLKEGLIYAYKKLHRWETTLGE